MSSKINLVDLYLETWMKLIQNRDYFRAFDIVVCPPPNLDISTIRIPKETKLTNYTLGSLESTTTMYSELEIPFSNVVIMYPYTIIRYCNECWENIITCEDLRKIIQFTYIHEFLHYLKIVDGINSLIITGDHGVDYYKTEIMPLIETAANNAKYPINSPYNSDVTMEEADINRFAYYIFLDIFSENKFYDANLLAMTLSYPDWAMDSQYIRVSPDEYKELFECYRKVNGEKKHYIRYKRSVLTFIEYPKKGIMK